MAPFASILRRTASAFHPLQQARGYGAKVQAADDQDSGWSFYHSSDELLSGLDVTEHSAPPALLELLREALAA